MATDALLKEINSIGDKALEMAESVLENPALRDVLGKEGKTLEKRLFHLAEELERTDPPAYKLNSDQVSESLLDLLFVQMDSESISLRLSRIIEQWEP
jgi:hypothetical protein